MPSPVLKYKTWLSKTFLPYHFPKDAQQGETAVAKSKYRGLDKVKTIINNNDSNPGS